MSRIRFRDLTPIWKVIFTFVAIILIIVWAFFVSGCAGTVRPDRVESATIAYDESGEQNAGVLKVWADKGALLTEAKKREYDALLARYGKGTAGHPLVPPVVKGRGLTRLRGADEGFPQHGWVWLIDPLALEYFLLFKAWDRQGRTPL